VGRVAFLDKAEKPLEISEFTALAGFQEAHRAGDGQAAERVVPFAPPVCSPDQPLHIHCGAGQSGLDAVQERPGGADQGGAEVAEKGHKGASGILPEEELSAAPTSDVGAAPWGCGLKGGGLWSSVLSVRMPVKAVPRANLALPVEPVP